MNDATAALATLKFDINDFHECLMHARCSHEEYMKTLSFAALLFFTAALVAVYLGLVTPAVALLAGAAAFYQMASHHHLLADMADAQWFLALLIANGSDRGRG